jgi:hypothetical protein
VPRAYKYKYKRPQRLQRLRPRDAFEAASVTHVAQLLKGGAKACVRHLVQELEVQPTQTASLVLEVRLEMASRPPLVHGHLTLPAHEGRVQHEVVRLLGSAHEVLVVRGEGQRALRKSALRCIFRLIGLRDRSARSCNGAVPQDDPPSLAAIGVRAEAERGALGAAV